MKKLAHVPPLLHQHWVSSLIDLGMAEFLCIPLFLNIKMIYFLLIQEWMT